MPNVIATNVIKTHIEAIERLEREAGEVDQAIADAFVAAKSAGLDLKILRSALKKRKQDQGALAEAESLEKLYLEAAK